MSSQESKSAYHLIEFTQGSDVYRYTNWSETVQGYAAFPEIDIEISALTGTFEEEEARIKMPKDSFIEKLIRSGMPEPVRVRIVEIQLDSSGQQVSQSAAFGGNVAFVRENIDGLSSMVEVECGSIKNRLNSELGIPVGPLCWKRFLGTACGLKEEDFTYSCVVQSIDSDNFILIVSGLPDVPDSEWFAGGWLTFNGIRVACRYWSQNAPGLVYVRQIPPDEWVGETVQFTSGCLKRQSDCDARNNSIRFGGIGKKIPAYTPHFETGSFVE